MSTPIYGGNYDISPKQVNFENTHTRVSMSTREYVYFVCDFAHENDSKCKKISVVMRLGSKGKRVDGWHVGSIGRVDEINYMCTRIVKMCVFFCLFVLWIRRRQFFFVNGVVFGGWQQNQSLIRHVSCTVCYKMSSSLKLDFHGKNIMHSRIIDYCGFELNRIKIVFTLKSIY